MSDVFDMAAVMGEITAAADLVETCELAADQNALDNTDTNAEIGEDLPAGFVVVGQGALLVQGAVRGDEENGCRIEVSGDVVVTGDLQCAHITANNIYLGGNVRECHLTAPGNIHIGGNALATRLRAGVCQQQLDRLQQVQNRLTPALNELTILERRVPLKEARMDRQCRAASMPLNFSMGQLIRHENGIVCIDLSMIFASIGEKQEKQLDLALAEFFAKGIIGVVTRTNRKYLDNQAREIVFMRLLGHLRELYMMVARKERLTIQLKQQRAELNALRTHLEESVPAISIAGDCDSSCALEFRVPQIEQTEDGSLECSDRGIGLRLRPGPDITYWELQVQKTRRDVLVHQLPQSRGLVLRCSAGEVTWSQMDLDVVHG